MISRAAASFAGVLGGKAWLLRFALDKLSDGFATGDWGVALGSRSLFGRFGN